MRAAAHFLIGRHDFRNFCKMDIANVSNFEREILNVEIRPFSAEDAEAVADYFDERSIYVIEISGVAFLWHMIRCIMSVLFMVGKGDESPDVIEYLLDIQRCPAKPHYAMACELPLVLHACDFDFLKFNYEPQVAVRNC
jgi:tRNA pseudouridine38/39 synthase